MNILHAALTGLMTIMVVFFLVGCAAPPKETRSGFLDNYSAFQPGPAEGVDQLYIKPGTDLKKYNRVMREEA